VNLGVFSQPNQPPDPTSTHPPTSPLQPTNPRRVGRTARYLSTGRALLLLLPSEKEGMLAALEEAKVPVKLTKHNPAKLQPIGPAMQVGVFGWWGAGCRDYRGGGSLYGWT
jgi:hypothetical protein